uniref:HEPN domain-containing protein n=1 Tax=Anaerococcus sp. TaxID=1872515 RepID=UPI0027BACE68
EIDIEDEKYNNFSIPQLIDDFSEDVSFKDKYNEFVNYRNRVAHQNKYPNITSDDVGKIVNIFKKFIKEIDKELTHRLKEMKVI